MTPNVRSKYIVYPPEKLKNSQLPTCADVVKAFIHEHSINNSNIKEKCKVITNQIEEIWAKTTIPRQTHNNVLKRVKDLQQQYSSLLKSKSSKYFDVMLKKFTDKNNQLFDISLCRCRNIYECICKNDSKVPQAERDFLIDQRTLREFVFDSIDFMSIARFNRKQEMRENANKCKSVSTKIVESKQNTERSERISKRNKVILNENSPPVKKLKLNNTALMLDKHNISDRAAANIVNAVVKDIADKSGQELEEAVTDRNGVRRARARTRTNISKSHLKDIHEFVDISDCVALFFDGKIDKTTNSVLNETNNRFHPRIEPEDHISIVIEPGNRYYSHITCNGKKAVDIATGIFEKLEADNFNLEKIVFVGCDGTNVNVGNKNGE